MLRAQRTWKLVWQPPGCWHPITAPSVRPQMAHRDSSLKGEARNPQPLAKPYLRTEGHCQHGSAQKAASNAQLGLCHPCAPPTMQCNQPHTLLGPTCRA